MEYKYINIITFVWVTDMEKSLHFYTKILGFKQGSFSKNWVELSVPGLHTVYFALNKWDSDKRMPTNDFVTLGVDNIEKFRKFLDSQDIQIKEETEFYEEGIKMVKFLDPDKNIITAAEILKP